MGGNRTRNREQWFAGLGAADAAVVDALRLPLEGRGTVVSRVVRSYAEQVLGRVEVMRVIRAGGGIVPPSPLVAERKARTFRTRPAGNWDAEDSGNEAEGDSLEEDHGPKDDAGSDAGNGKAGRAEGRESESGEDDGGREECERLPGSESEMG